MQGHISSNDADVDERIARQSPMNEIANSQALLNESQVTVATQTGNLLILYKKVAFPKTFIEDPIDQT